MRIVVRAGLIFVSAIVVLAVLAIDRNVPREATVLVIGPGNEETVRVLLAPLLDGGFVGHPIDTVEIAGSEIHVQLGGAAAGGCVLPEWAHPPGALSLSIAGEADGKPELRSGSRAVAGDLALSWWLCGEAVVSGAASVAQRLATEMAQRSHAEIWSDHSPRVSVAIGGLLSPVADALRIRNVRGLVGLLLGAPFIVTMLWALQAARHEDARRRGRRETPDPGWPTLERRSSRRRGLLTILFVVGAVLRVATAIYRPFDGDEVWAMPRIARILSDSRDAWVHPPLHHILQQTWVHLAYGPSSGVFALRVPSVAFAVATLAIVVVVALESGSLASLVPVALLALGPLVDEAVVARPYALAALFAALVSAAGIAATRDEGNVASSSALMIAATGLALWTDLIAGFTCAALAVLLLSEPARALSGRQRITGIVVLAVWCAALVPGALVALHSKVYVGAGTGDLRPEHGIGHGNMGVAALGLASVGVLDFYPARPVLGALGVVALVALAAWGMRLRRTRVGFAPLIAWALLVAFSTRVYVRERHALQLSSIVSVCAAALLVRGDERRARP